MGFSIFTDLISPTKYKVPDAPNINLDTLGTDTTKANAATFAGAKDLASQYNDFMRGELQKQLGSIPGFQNLTNQLSQNLSAQLKGELTQSDLASEQRTSAANALGLGISGSQAGAAYSAYNIGKRQYQVQQGAQQQGTPYLSTMANIYRSPMYDMTSSFLSARDRAALEWQNQTAAFNVQNLRNQMAVQPAPWMRSLAGAGDSIVNAVAAYYGMGGGGPSTTSQGGGFNSFGGSNAFSEGTGGGGLTESTISPYNLGGYSFGNSFMR